MPEATVLLDKVIKNPNHHYHEDAIRLKQGLGE